MKNLIIVIKLILLSILFNETRCKPVVSSAPSCSVIAGREYVITFKRPTKMQNTKNLYLEWSINGVKDTASARCHHSSNTDRIVCPTSWSLFNKHKMEGSVMVQVINKTTNKIVWKHPYSFVPYRHLFDCFENMNIRGLKLSETRNNNKWKVSWSPMYWAAHFGPRFNITINNEFFKTVNSKQCKHEFGEECQIKLPDKFRAEKYLEVCIKSIFDLKGKKNYHTTTTKTVEQCTVDTLSSKYRLKVINVETGQEVIDYGLWHHPLGEKLNETTLQEIKKTKWKVNNVFNKTIEESSSMKSKY